MFGLQVSKIYASSLSETLSSGVSNISGSDTVSSFTTSLLSFAIPLAVFSVFILLAFAAFQLMTSQGNPDKLKEGKEVITNAIIGFVFILLSVAILMLISNIFGIKGIGN
jgi:hypothetical protein